jgi:beta-lactamase class A
MFAAIVTAILIALSPAISRGEQAATTDAHFAALEARTHSRLGLVVTDPSSDLRIEYRGQERFLMCSTFKVLAVAAVLQRADAKNERLDRFISYTEKQLVAHSPVTSAHLKEGRMTLESLCAAAIVQSDNTAGNLLLDVIGGPPGLTEYARSLGDEVTRLDRVEPDLNVALPNSESDTTSAAAIARDLAHLFTSQALSDESRARLEKWMQACETGLTMVRATLPEGWQAGDKTGRGAAGQTNDVAILRRPNKQPVFVAIYALLPDEPTEGRDRVVADAAEIALKSVSERPTDLGPCARSLERRAVCDAANARALDLMRAGNLEATMVVQDVQSGSLVAFAASHPGELDVTTKLSPLSPIKLLTAASWLDHGRAKQENLSSNDQLLTDSIANGNDDAGRRIASALRNAIGPKAVLDDLAKYGFPQYKTSDAGEDNLFWNELSPPLAKRLHPSVACHSLNSETFTKDWEDTLSLGEKGVVVTALHLSRFLQAIGNGGLMLPPVARTEDDATTVSSTKPTRIMNEETALKLQKLMRDTVERGTAKAAAPILAPTGWTMGGKTGTGPQPGSNEAGPASDGCFVGLIFDPQLRARFTVVTFVNHGGFGGGNAARLSAEIARWLAGMSE